MGYLKWFILVGARRWDWILTALSALLYFWFFMNASGCATLKQQAADMHESQAAALLHDIGTLASDFQQCDPNIVAQVSIMFFNRDFSQLGQPIACIVIAARETEAQVRTGTVPPPALETLQIVKGVTSIRVQVVARTKQ